MSNEPGKPKVSFTTNLAAKDSVFAEQILRHMIRTLDYPFCERFVAFDDSPLEGIYSERQAGRDTEDQEQFLARLLATGIVDRVEIVPWETDSWQPLMEKYFGGKQRGLEETRDGRGGPVYQYLFALDQCVGDYVLHTDSDIFFCCAGKTSWIDEGIELMQQDESVVMVTPGYAPAARNAFEFALGRRLGSRSDKRWFPAKNVSTRYFLWDKNRVEKMIPFNRLEIESFERSLTRALATNGCRRLVLDDPDTWAMHPVPHNERFQEHLTDFVWAAENNVYPFRRRSKRPWNIHMDDETDVRQWLKVIKRARKFSSARSDESRAL